MYVFIINHTDKYVHGYNNFNLNRVLVTSNIFVFNLVLIIFQEYRGHRVHT